jgi:hypothetical protein
MRYLSGEDEEKHKISRSWRPVIESRPEAGASRVAKWQHWTYDRTILLQKFPTWYLTHTYTFFSFHDYHEIPPEYNVEAILSEEILLNIVAKLSQKINISVIVRSRGGCWATTIAVSIKYNVNPCNVTLREEAPRIIQWKSKNYVKTILGVWTCSVATNVTLHWTQHPQYKKT